MKVDKKAVMISVRPKWCALIASGEKTIEVRKNRPKLSAPFKCFIYCTKENDDLKSTYRGKVIGEFICDRVELYTNGQAFAGERICISLRVGARLAAEEVRRYSGGKPLYGWHISCLKIYDKPRELAEFVSGPNNLEKDQKYKGMERPPQSWCYVEERAENEHQTNRQ